MPGYVAEGLSAAAAMTAALAITASAASTVPEIATSAAIPATATVIDGPSVGVAYVADTTAVDGSVLVVKADGVNADVVFAGENNNPDAPIKIVFAEKTDGVIVTATDGIDLLQE